jgi:protein phosphatase
LLVLFALFGGGLWYGWAYTQSQYYVGVTEDGVVAVFRGVPGQIAGLRLSSVYQTSDTRIEDLNKVTQDTVRQGIQADNQDDARAKLAELTSDDPSNPHKLPLCTPSPSPPAPTPTVTGATAGSPTPTPSVEESVVPTTSPSCRPN